jgi:hypothetical protein
MEQQPNKKEDARAAYLKRLQIYWGYQGPHKFNTHVGDIYEVDFGENVGDEFSGRHLGICLEDTSPSQTKVTVIPLTTKYAKYNIRGDDLIETTSIIGNVPIVAGVVVGEAKRISKIRIFPRSTILEEPPDATLCYAKAYVKLDKRTVKRWRTL